MRRAWSAWCRICSATPRNTVTRAGRSRSRCGAGGEAIIVVADNGPGIAPEDQGRIFERYYRPVYGDGRRSPGSGLGLPIVQALAALHGGRAWVESTPGQGAAFAVTLPLARAGYDTALRQSYSASAH